MVDGETPEEAIRNGFDAAQAWLETAQEFGDPIPLFIEAGTRRSTMKKMLQLTAVIEREGDGYVATCPELDVVSQGETVETARLNLVEAVEGFLEVASPSEVRRRLKTETAHV